MRILYKDIKERSLAEKAPIDWVTQLCGEEYVNKLKIFGGIRFRNLVIKCVNIKPENRPNIKTILKKLNKI